MISPERMAVFGNEHVRLERVACPSCGATDGHTISRSMDYDYFTTKQVFSVIQCAGCGLLYVNPRPALTEIDKIYPSRYSAYEFHRIKNPIIRWVRNFMQAKKAKRILRCLTKTESPVRIMDVGCGGTALLSFLHACADKPLELYGNDFSQTVLDDVKRAGFHAIPGPFESVQCEQGYFDAVVMNQVIEHLFDVRGNMKKTAELLKPGGILYIETPSDEGIDAKVWRHGDWGGYHLPRHLQLFNEKTLSRLLNEYGFVVESIEYLPSPNFWTSSLRNLLFRAGAPLWLTRRMNYRNIFYMSVFTALDVLTRPIHKTSNMRIIARKVREDRY